MIDERPAVYAPTKVEITRISVPLGDLFVFMLKLTIASIPAMVIGGIIVALLSVVFAAIWGVGLGQIFGS